MTPPKANTVPRERSRSVRSMEDTAVPTLCPICAIPRRNDSIMVGIDFTRVMMPAVATAPAPM